MNSILELVSLLFFAGVTTTLSIIDLKTKLLPNRIMLPSVLLIHLLLIASALTAQHRSIKIFDTLVGTTVMFATFLLLGLLAKGQLGGGDVKFAALLGPVLGYFGGLSTVVRGIIAIAVVGGVTAIALMLTAKNQNKDIAFGPIMTAGSWIGLLAGLNWS